MVLVDTSVWVLHLREGNAHLEELLNKGDVIGHPFIIGELACGNIRNRAEMLSLLQALPAAVPAEHQEVMEFIERHRLMGRGLGYVDAHLIASAELTDVPIWTFDKPLDIVSAQLGRSFSKG